MFLFSVGQIKRGFLESISNYFGIVKTNDYRILHLYCFIWLKDVLHLATLQMQIKSNNKFCQKLFSFLKLIIKCLVDKNLHLQTLDQFSPNVNNLIIILPFINLLKLDNEAIGQKFQMHIPFHNSRCYKYNIHKSKVYRFDFL